MPVSILGSKVPNPARADFGEIYLNSKFSAGGGNAGIGIPETSVSCAKLGVNGSIRATGTVTWDSDRRFKKNILPIANASAKIDSLNGVTYEWKTEDYPDRNFDSGTQLGFIAQEVEKVVPEIVHTDAKGFKSMDYSRVVPLLVEAAKEQRATIKNLQDQITGLKALICQYQTSAAVCAAP